MRKLCILSGLMFIFLSATYSQAFYVRTGLGYSFTQMGQSVSGSGEPFNGTLNSSTNAYDLKNASFTAGLSGTLGCGVYLGTHIAIELNGSFGIHNNEYVYRNMNATLNSILTNVTLRQHASTFILLPSVLYQTNGEKVNFYGRFGLALPVVTKITRELNYVNVPGTATPLNEVDTWSQKQSFTLGYTAGLGMHYAVSRDFTLWAEFTVLSLSPFIRERDLESVTANGINYNIAMLNGTKNYYYSKNSTIATDQRVAYSLPFSNAGLNLGVSCSFGTHAKKKLK